MGERRERMKGNKLFWALGVLIVLVSVLCSAVACHAKKGEDDMEEDPKAATLSVKMMNDGGIRYTLIIEDESIVEYSTKNKGKGEKNEQGGSYTRVYVFTGKKAGTTSLTMEEYLHGDLESTRYYIITVDDDLNVKIKEDEDRVDPKKMPLLIIGDREIPIRVEKNESAALFFGESKRQSLGVMDDLDGNEKTATLLMPFSDDELKTVEVQPGDLICFHKTIPIERSNGETMDFPVDFAIVYEPHTVECVVIGHLQDIDPDELRDLLNQDVEKVLDIPRV